MLVVSEAIFGKVGNNESMILTWAIHDPFEHILISLSLARDRGHSQDGILRSDRWLSLFPRELLNAGQGREYRVPIFVR
jgi:hypothetical protein